jgi:hypothetical protein
MRRPTASPCPQLMLTLEHPARPPLAPASEALLAALADLLLGALVPEGEKQTGQTGGADEHEDHH